MHSQNLSETTLHFDIGQNSFRTTVVGYISRNKRGIGCQCATKTRLSRCESPVRCASEVILSMILPTANNIYEFTVISSLEKRFHASGGYETRHYVGTNDEIKNDQKLGTATCIANLEK